MPAWLTALAVPSIRPCNAIRLFGCPSACLTCHHPHSMACPGGGALLALPWVSCPCMLTCAPCASPHAGALTLLAPSRDTPTPAGSEGWPCQVRGGGARAPCVHGVGSTLWLAVPWPMQAQHHLAGCACTPVVWCGGGHLQGLGCINPMATHWPPHARTHARASPQPGPWCCTGGLPALQAPQCLGIAWNSISCDAHLRWVGTCTWGGVGGVGVG